MGERGLEQAFFLPAARLFLFVDLKTGLVVVLVLLVLNGNVRLGSPGDPDLSEPDAGGCFDVEDRVAATVAVMCAHSSTLSSSDEACVCAK